MENQFEYVETDSNVDFELDVEPRDPNAEFHVHARDKEAGQMLAGSAEAVTVGPRTDADTRQATAPNVGHIATGFEPRGDPAAIPPNVALEARADHHGAEYSALNPVGVAEPYLSTKVATGEESWEVLWTRARFGSRQSER